MSLRVAAVQHDIAWLDREANYAHLAPMVAAAAGAGAGLVLLSETFATGFAVGDPSIAEPEDGPSASFLREQAAAHGVWVGGTCAEVAADDPRPANTFVLAGPDGTVHRYRKIHPFGFGGEEQHIRAGTDLVTVTIDGVRCSLFVCYDLRFADEFWGLANATDAYLVPANWPTTRSHHWRTLLQARAIENQAYVVGVNRVGTGDGLTYRGDTAIIDPLGEHLATGSTTETIVIADIDPARVREVREQLPFLPDRR